MQSLSTLCFHIQNVENSMDILTKAGQLFIIGFQGSNLSPADQIYKDIKDHNLGGVILFDKLLAKKLEENNILSFSQVRDLTTELQSISDTNLFIGIDQEGGYVARLKEDRGFPPTEAMEDIGQKNDTGYTFLQSSRTAALLHELGINLNFSPVVDIKVNPENPVIARFKRAFSSKPRNVTQHAEAWIKAHAEQNIISCIKHFPGHGSSMSDSHKGFVDITESWQDFELEPFSTLIEQNRVDMVMTGHLFNRRLDPKHPATLSKKIITSILRDKLQFRGVIVSDDMQMSAITDHYTFEEAIIRCFASGVDMCIMGNNLKYDEKLLEKSITAIAHGLEQNRLSEKQLEESYNRVITIKKNYL